LRRSFGYAFFGSWRKNLRNLPDAIAKRDILFNAKKTTATQLADLAKAFEDAGWLSDAADFWNQTQNKDALRKLRQGTIEEGNTFLFLKTTRYLGEEDNEALLKCTQAAEKLGKNRYAIKGYEKLERTEDLERVRALVANDGDIIAEAESKVFIPLAEDEIADET